MGPLRQRVLPVRILAPMLLLLSATALLGTGCQRAPEPRLVILYATCSLNRSFLQPYEPGVSYTPTLAELGRNGVVFERHQTESGQSGVSFASIFTGLQAPGHGIYRHPNVLAEEKLLIGELFAEAGWETHAFLNHGMATAGLGYAQGVPPARARPRTLEGDLASFISLLGSLRSDPERRAFVVTNFTDTHAPYRAESLEDFCASFPGECAKLGDREEARQIAGLMWLRSLDLIWDFERTIEELGYDERQKQRLLDVVEILYKSNVWRLDRRVGKLVAAIRDAGLLDETLLVFTADHGEILHREGAHFSFTHGFQLAPEVLNVPLIVYGPGAGVEAARYEPVTRSIDVMWTTAGLAGVPVPAHGGDGRDLSAAVRGEEPPPALVAYSHTALQKDALWRASQRSRVWQRLHPTQGPESMWVGARRGDLLFQLRRGLDGSWQMRAIDLSAGPGGADRFDPEDEHHAEMATALAAYKALLVEDASRALRAELPISDEKNRALLRLLGYIE
jgi:arylsulfatase A-like enzyme